MEGTRQREDAGSSRGHVHVVDDEPAVTVVIARVLRKAGYRVETWNDPQTFLAGASPEPPCCVVLDLHMPGLTGVELQSRLVARECPPAIVFVSGGADVPSSVRAMKAGAVDFLQKPFKNDDLVAAVAAAMARNQEECDAHREARAARERLARLTPREREVADCLERGLRSKEIASELGTAVKTVDVHRARVMEKLGIDSVAELVRLVQRSQRM
jgi:FixJ family two-component response regulator